MRMEKLEGSLVEVSLYTRDQAHKVWAFDEQRLPGTRIGGEVYYSGIDLNARFLRWSELRTLWPASWGLCNEEALCARHLLLEGRRRLRDAIQNQFRSECAKWKSSLLRGLGLGGVYHDPYPGSRCNWGLLEEPFDSEEELANLIAREWANPALNLRVEDWRRWALAIIRFPQLQAPALAWAL